MKNKKNRNIRLKHIGLILASLVAFSSCAQLVCMDDANKLQQLEADYKAGKVSRKYYKSEKSRLNLEIRENQKVMADCMAHPINPPVDENGNQVGYGDGGDQVGDDDGGGEVVEEPVFVCENIYYYPYHGRYYYFENGQRRFVSRLPANSIAWQEVIPIRGRLKEAIQANVHLEPCQDLSLPRQ